MGIARLRDVPWSAPSMLNIDHLRKQAKLYLRWHREQYSLRGRSDSMAGKRSVAEVTS